MAVSAGIFLVVIGAILAFAVTADTQGIDLSMAGWILMIAGVAAAILGAMTHTTGGRYSEERDRDRAA